MKKLLFGMLAAVGLLATSCSSDDLINPTVNGDYVVANFTLDTPEGIQSRAIGDGTTVDNVACAVFDADGNELTDLRKDDVAISGKTATYSAKLVKGKAYRVVFFAYNAAAAAYDFSDMKQILVKDSQLSNLEGRDAFTAYTDITVEESMSPIERTIPLFRPFAQLNLGTDDMAIAAQAGGISIDKTSVTVTNVYSAFNAYEDKVAGETSTVTFAANTIPTEKLKVTVNGKEEEYDYLALNYLLVGDKDAEKSLTDVEFVVKPTSGADVTATFTNVPVQRNYRTNIVGSLLTNPAQFNIVIDANFQGDLDLLAWRNVYVKEPKMNDDGSYAITNMYELNWVAMQTVGENPSVSRADATPNNFAGKTIKLMNDIDFTGNFLQPIGGNLAPKKGFSGTFDGQGFAVKNFKVKSAEAVNAAAGLFGNLIGSAVVKNVNVDNATVNSTHYAGGIVGYVGANSGALVENCNVTNSTITSETEWTGSAWDNGDKVGGIVGYLANGGNKVSGCSVSNTTIQGYRDLGGIVGCADANSIVSGNTIGSSVTVKVDATHNYKNYTKQEQYNANHIVGRNIKATIEGNTGECTLIIPQSTVSVKTAAELHALLTTFTGAGAGDNTINIEEDITLKEGETWTPITVDGYHGAGKITLNGNGHYIKGLNAPLFGGGFAGTSGIIINDLTIKDCSMTAPSGSNQGFATFIMNIDSMPYIELSNCVAENITITAASGNDDRIGGLIGWTSGWNGGGSVDTYIYVKNCKVSNCNISSNGSIGGIIGHAGANPATFHFFTNTVVENCTLTSANSSSWRAGALVGTANVGQVTITGCTDSSNTVSQPGCATPADFAQGNIRHFYGRIALGSTGTLTIDGVEVK